MSFECAICGQYHGEPLRDIAYKYPAEYFTVPADEREKRVFVSDDFCVIDDKVFVIRGLLCLPIDGTDEEFRWGVWAVISQDDFKRYLELWDSPAAEAEPPFMGRLSGGIHAYQDSDLLPVSVHLQSGNKRPVFKVISEEHPLGRDQRQGISQEKAHSFVFGVQQAEAEGEAQHDRDEQATQKRKEEE